MRRRQGFTLVEIMIVVAIIALLAAIAVPGLLRARLNANDSAAKANIQSLSTACESYAAAMGVYPTAMAQLTGANPPYLQQLPNATGYTIPEPTWQGGGGYTITATPISCGTTGTKIFNVTTGANVQEADC